MNSIDFKVKGYKELMDRLNSVPEKVARKAVRSGLQKGAEVIAGEAKLRARKHRGAVPRHPEYGHLDDNIGVKSVRATVDGGTAKVGIGDAFWGLWLEYGSGKPNDPYNPNTFGARAFMRPAFDAKENEALDLFIAEIKAGLDEVGN